MNKCPCTNCVCMPICRHKLYGYLFRDCALLRNYMPKHDVIHLRHIEKMETIVEILQPSHWKYKINYKLNTKFPIVEFTGTPEQRRMQLREGDIDLGRVI